MSKYLGDYNPSQVVYGKFTTFRPSTGATFTLGGTPVLSVYKDNSTTQSTTGVTLTADFDSVTGFNHFAIDTSTDGSFYAAGSNFDVVITTGTIDSVSVVGTVVASFSLRKKSTQHDAVLGAPVAVVKSATSQSIDIFIQSAVSFPGAGLTGLAYNTAGLAAYYRRGATGTATNIPLATQTVGGAYSSGGFAQIDPTNAPGLYRLDLPDAVVASGVDRAVIYLQGAANMIPVIKELELFDPASTALNTVRKNSALAAFPFKMVDATDLKTAETGIVVTATRSLNGGAFGACANSPAEVANGWYKIDLAAGDLNADTVVLRFTGTGCHPTEITIFPQPT